MREISIIYLPIFLREFRKLPSDVQEEAKLKINLFKDTKNHKQLRVHKLKGRLRDKYSFSITYSHRVVFMLESKNTAVFLVVGAHDVYK